MSKKNKAIEWDGKCEEAFQQLKEICTFTAILGYGNFMKPFNLLQMHAFWDWGQSYTKIKTGLIGS